MRRRICLYCPDRHLQYDGTTPDLSGVGGGVTARIRIAEALARRGHEMTMVCNAPGVVRHAGVLYVPLDAVSRIDGDVLILHSSGGGLNLSPIRDVAVHTPIQVLFLSGPEPPKSSTTLRLNAAYAPCNFVRDAVATTFPRIFVSHHGVVKRATDGTAVRENPLRLLYASHPSKGLSAAIAVWKLLRRNHPGAELHVCGGNRLWGGADDPPEAVSGLVYHGLLGQQEMIEQYRRASFGLFLQNRLEPFGLTLVESMAMGCIPVASAVGSYPELVRDGVEGYLFTGDCDDPAIHDVAARAISQAASDPQLLAGLRRSAVAAPMTWDTVAATWEAHWDLLSGVATPPSANQSCRQCGGSCARYPDGVRCLECGSYFRISGTGN